jgi:hypothetical protein
MPLYLPRHTTIEPDFFRATPLQSSSSCWSQEAKSGGAEDSENRGDPVRFCANTVHVSVMSLWFYWCGYEPS